MTANQVIEESANNVPTIDPPKSIYGARHTQTILLFFLIFLGYGMRVNFSEGLFHMTYPSNINPSIPTYDWSNISELAHSFYWGYVLTQLAAGQLAEAYGAKWLLASSMLVNSIFSILLPIMARVGSGGVMGCRIIQGLAQGFFFPSCHNLMSKWYPPHERTRLSVFVYAGGSFGSLISLIVTDLISNSIVGWPFAFYTYGFAGCLWVVAWIFLGSDSPAVHPSIDPKEKEYIQASLGQTEIKAPPPTPWSSIFTSLPVWAILIAHCGQKWAFATMLTSIQVYLPIILEFNTTGNGIVSIGPYITFWVLSFVYSFSTDYLIKCKVLSTGVARKVANSLGLYVPAAALLTLGLISGEKDKDNITQVTIALIFVAISASSSSLCGYHVNHIDISPSHAGTLMGITNTFSTIAVIITPHMINGIVTDMTDAEQWAAVFYIAAGIYAIGNTFFVIFGSGEIQSWDSIVKKG